MDKTPKQPRGVRNNNPGNIRRSRDRWQGLAPQQTDKDFFQFSAPIWGIRALAKVLLTYQRKHGLYSVEEIIQRYAPPNENNTGAYVKAVSEHMTLMNIPSLVDLEDPHHLAELMNAIIRHENGVMPYHSGEIYGAIELAYKANAKPLTQSRTMRGAAVAVASTTATPLLNLDQAHALLPLASDALQYAPWLLAAVGLCALCYVVYARWDDHRAGLR